MHCSLLGLSSEVERLLREIEMEEVDLLDYLPLLKGIN